MAVKTKVGYSRSPEKPRRLINFLHSNNLLPDYFEIESEWLPFFREHFLIAHEKSYVDDFFAGEPPLCNSNGLQWSEEFARSVTYTNASLYNAIKNSIINPSEISLSPTSGFHHSRPGLNGTGGGGGFCTFSGQVIASVMIYRETGLRGAFLDLDQHVGNSIFDSYEYVPDLKFAVPHGFNMNPEGINKAYLKSVRNCLSELWVAIIKGQIDYVVFCHGADSADTDDMFGQCTSEEWLQCSKMFYSWVNEINKKTSKQLPVILSLFGGYRSDDYNSVLSLHTADLVCCLNTLCGHSIIYKPEVKPRNSTSEMTAHETNNNIQQTKLDL